MAKLVQQWLVCAPLGINLESINNIIIINCTTGPKRELCSAKKEALWTNDDPYELIKNTASLHIFSNNNCMIELTDL